MTEKKKVGRPSEYTEEKGKEICVLLMQPKTLRAICKMNGMPDQSTVFRWLTNYPEFHKMYAKAREIQAHMFADEIIEISDDSSQDEMISPKGFRMENVEFVNRSKLRVDARKWLASKVAPKKYGDKVEDTTVDKLLEVVLKMQDDKPAKPDGNA